MISLKFNQLGANQLIRLKKKTFKKQNLRKCLNVKSIHYMYVLFSFMSF